MTDLLLIYPYFNDDESIFKFPPLGLGYIASYVRSRGYTADIIDCTFLTEKEATRRAKNAKARVIGISCMSSMRDSALKLARGLRGSCEHIIAGGPLPTARPAEFLDHFDLVVLGEGEETVLELLQAYDSGMDHKELGVKGVSFRQYGGPKPGLDKKREAKHIITPPRQHIKDLDSIPFPSRDLFDHESYKRYFKDHHGYTITSMMASRGCPFDCEFCSRPIFGRSYRGRSTATIVDEMEEIVSYGYDRIWIADDVFPLNRKMGEEFCGQLIKRRVEAAWESLCRVDILDQELAAQMKKAGCYRLFFGMESGNDSILALMNKQTRVDQEKKAVGTAKSVGIKTGGFFILGYPGETDETMLDTMRMASSLPLDYVSITMPYPIPGTRLYDRVGKKMTMGDMKKGQGLVKHVLTYDSDFSSFKLKFGITKTMVQHYTRKHLGSWYGVMKPFETVTDLMFKKIR